MDLSTLLARANDAIDTVIRRDKSTESGQYLQPCIEGKLKMFFFFCVGYRSFKFWYV